MATRVEINVPDIGDFDEVEIVEVLVGAGDRVGVEDSLVTLESDKASMEIPSPHAGTVVELRVQVGDKVSEGTLLAVLEVDAVEAAPPPAEEAPASPPPRPEPAPVEAASPAASVPHAPPVPPAPAVPSTAAAHASPGIRRMARELGVDLAQASGSGPHGRVLEGDLKEHVRRTLQSGAGPAAASLPAVDFAAFGPVEERPLTRIRRTAARNLAASWPQVPQVTQHDHADVTELEAFRRGLRQRAEAEGVKVTPVAVLLKACAVVLREFPDFRSSLAPSGEALVVKDYIHIGVAVDTEAGLVVPVVRDVDQKGLLQLSRDLTDLSERARARKLKPADLQGGVFSLSSLGGIGGTAFTPLVKAPEVAILGVSRIEMRPVWDGEAFGPRQVLPLSLSYDHRVIDGAAAVRFTTALRSVLESPANLLL
ncbi:MAG: 2-oxo acid dehydrogenase subunit E2 [Proteobacteria bacterium]|nr:2-oxo acid dehydrogenase subunit E2 [Pseudomonadota bacterium]